MKLVESDHDVQSRQREPVNHKSRMALAGKHLKVAAGIWVPYVLLNHDEDGKLIGYSGILIEFMDLFAKRLNFTYSIVEAADGEWGRILSNGSATGMVGLCHRKEVDMALGPFSITRVRLPFVDYSVPLFMDGSGIFLPRPTLERDLAGFAKPFAWQVWLGIMIFLAASMTIGLAINYLVQRWGLKPQSGVGQSHRRARGRQATFKAVWLIQLLLAEPVDVPPMVLTGKIFLGTWMLVAVILSSAYQGILTSLLAVPKVEIPVDSLQDLVDYGKIPWANEYGTSLHQMFGDSKSGVHKKINDGAFLVVASWDVRERIKKEKFAVLCDFYSMKKIISDDFSALGECNYYIAKQTIWYTNFAFAFPKHSPIIPLFDKLITMMKEGGLINRYRGMSIPNATHCMVRPGKEGGTKSLVLSMDDLTGIFLLVVGGVTLGIFAIIIELILHKLKKD
ncbi:probable glutamate receptor isoform X1 [Macrobrachium rosenbergii]|uniref:probable glutamate receptor isoform X1 n=2 Tax=Macrobrachium rosenbergii TaxID=79674 RepID=UPI0034D3D518